MNVEKIMQLTEMIKGLISFAKKNDIEYSIVLGIVNGMVSSETREQEKEKFLKQLKENPFPIAVPISTFWGTPAAFASESSGKRNTPMF